MTVSRSVGTEISADIGMVTGPPQLNTTTPPAWTAARRAPSVHPPASPSPTVAVGWEASARAIGAWQVLAGGAPASTVELAPSGGRAASSGEVIEAPSTTEGPSVAATPPSPIA